MDLEMLRSRHSARMMRSDDGRGLWWKDVYWIAALLLHASEGRLRRNELRQVFAWT